MLKSELVMGEVDDDRRPIDLVHIQSATILARLVPEGTQPGTHLIDRQANRQASRCRAERVLEHVRSPAAERYWHVADGGQGLAHAVVPPRDLAAGDGQCPTSFADVARDLTVRRVTRATIDLTSARPSMLNTP